MYVCLYINILHIDLFFSLFVYFILSIYVFFLVYIDACTYIWTRAATLAMDSFSWRQTSTEWRETNIIVNVI